MRGIARRGAVGAAVVLTALAIGGCTTVTSLTSTPSITDLPSRTDEITPTATPTNPGTATSTSGPGDATPGGAPTGVGASPTGPAPGGLRSTERLVILEDLGVAFAVPTLFTEVDPERLADAALGSPELKEAAERVGMSPAQLRNGMVNQMDRLYAGAGDNGSPTTVIAGRTPMLELPSNAALREQLRQGLGTDITRLAVVRTAAGSGVVATYSLAVRGRRSHGQIGLVDTSDGVVSVTVTGGSAEDARALMTRAFATIRHAE